MPISRRRDHASRKRCNAPATSLHLSATSRAKLYFVGLYAIGATTPLTRNSYLQIPANGTLKTHWSTQRLR